MSERKVDVFCTYCGARIPENTIYCPNCRKPKTQPPIQETRSHRAPFGITIPKRDLMEKDLMIIIFLIFGLIIKLARALGKNICLIGNVDTINVLLRGSSNDVEETVKKSIFNVAQDGGYILSTSKYVCKNTPMINMETFVRAGLKYGKYPIRRAN
jgi:hypothetical protein